MLEAHRGLRRPPFQDVPGSAFFFPSDRLREGLARQGQASLAGAGVCRKLDRLHRRARVGLEGGCHRPLE